MNYNKVRTRSVILSFERRKNSNKNYKQKHFHVFFIFAYIIISLSVLNFFHVDLSYCLGFFLPNLQNPHQHLFQGRTDSKKNLTFYLSCSLYFEGQFCQIQSFWVVSYFSFRNFNKSSKCLLASTDSNEQLFIDLFKSSLYLKRCFSCCFKKSLSLYSTI